MNFRNNFARLAETLLMKNEKDSALNVLNKCLEEMPDKTVPYNVMMLRPVELYYAIGRETPQRDTSLTAEEMELPAQKRQQAIETANAITKRSMLSAIWARLWPSSRNWQGWLRVQGRQNLQKTCRIVSRNLK
jgi:hypothetical protein